MELLKRKLVHHDENSLSSVPWNTVKEMFTFKKKYAKGYPFRITSKKSLEDLNCCVSDVEKRAKAERARKRRLENPFRMSSLLPNDLKQCWAALQGACGFSRKYKPSELIDFLNKHGFKSYTHGKFTSKIDSNFCKNQVRTEGYRA